MEKLIAQFPKHISDALEIARSTTFSNLNMRAFSNVVICGMGGSGIGGKLIAQLFAGAASTPIFLTQSYHVPHFVNDQTLFIASSYSGNTEETLAGTKDAAKKGATIICICSGGELYKLCLSNNYDVIKIPGGNPPRSMLAFSVIQLINVLATTEIIAKNTLLEVDLCRGLLNKELVLIKNEAKKIATFAYKKSLIIYSSSEYEAIAIRCRQQINENAKQLCWHHVIPEMNHNELVGWAGGSDEFAVLFLSSQFLHPRVRQRFDLTQNIIKDKTPHILEIKAKGDSVIKEAFYLIHLLDWASLYLAEKNRVDPVEVNVIDHLKKQLAVHA